MILDRTTRIKAAKAVSASGELETVKRAANAIGANETPLGVVEAAAVILLGHPRRKLSTKTVARLYRLARRHALVHGPVVELLLLAVQAELSSTRIKK